MKRVWIWLLCAALTVSLSACGEKPREAWREDVAAILSTLELPASGNALSACRTVGLLDVNFDGTPEVVASYPGGSAGNVFLEFYDLNTKAQIDAFSVPHGTDWEAALCVAVQNGEYVTLVEGVVRDDIGTVQEVSMLSETLEYIDVLCERIDGEPYYWANGRVTTKISYEEQKTAFWESCKKVDGAALQMIAWEEKGSDAERVEAMAEALVNSTQVFVAKNTASITPNILE